MASLAMTTTEWVNVSAMEWEDAPANMLHRSGGLLCTAWGCRKKHCLSAGSVSRMCQLFFFIITFSEAFETAEYWNDKQIILSSVPFQWVAARHSVWKKVMMHVFIQACVCSFCLTWFSRCLVWVKKSSFKPQIYLIECKRIFSGKISI